MLLRETLLWSCTAVASAMVVVPQPAANMNNFVLGTLSLATLEKPEQLLDQAWERGFTRYDLARTYGLGKSEKVFGDWKERNGIPREELDLVTKGGMGEDKYGHPDRKPCSLNMLQSEISASLDALRTDHVDLYMYHRDDPRINVEDFVDWMNELKREGSIQKWGVSNWNWERVRRAVAYANKNGLEPPTATSPQLSLAVPKGEVWPSTHSVSCPTQKGELDWYNRNNIQVMGWESLAKGFMADANIWKESSDIHTKVTAAVGTNDWRLQRLQTAYCTPQNYARREIALRMAKESGLTLAQISLLYVLSRGPHVSVLVGADCAHHLDEMCRVANYALEPRAVEELTEAGLLQESFGQNATEYAMA